MKEYDDIWFEQITRRDELIYSAALMDGILIGYWVGVGGTGSREDYCVSGVRSFNWEGRSFKSKPGKAFDRLPGIEL